MRDARVALLAAALWTICASAAGAGTLFVRADGRAADAEGTRQAPFPTIGEAIERAAAGDAIVVGPGSYGEIVVVSKEVTLIGQGAVLTRGDHQGAMVVFESSGALEGFVIVGRTPLDEAIGPPACVMVEQEAVRVVIRGNTLKNCMTGVDVNSPADVWIERNEISKTEFGVSTVNSGGTLYMHDNLIVHNAIGAFSAHGNLELRDNVIRDNGTGVKVAHRFSRPRESRVVLELNRIVGNERGVWLDRQAGEDWALVDLGERGFSAGGNVIRDNAEGDVVDGAAPGGEGSAGGRREPGPDGASAKGGSR